MPGFGRRLAPLLQARAKSAPKDASQSNDLGSSNRRRLTRGARRRRINSPRAGVGPGSPGKLCTRRVLNLAAASGCLCLPLSTLTFHLAPVFRGPDPALCRFSWGGAARGHDSPASNLRGPNSHGTASRCP